MKDHNFVPFNYWAQWCYGSNMKIEDECWLCFNPGIESGFLDFEEIVPRSQKPGFWSRAKFVLPTGCVQEVYVRNGESALEAFHRWQEAANIVAENAFAKFLATPTRSVWNEYCCQAYLSGFDATMCGRLLS